MKSVYLDFECVFSLASEPVESRDVVFQEDPTTLSATWSYNETEHLSDDMLDNLRITMYSVGSYPFATDIGALIALNVSTDLQSSLPIGAITPAINGKGGFPF